MKLMRRPTLEHLTIAIVMLIAALLVLWALPSGLHQILWMSGDTRYAVFLQGDTLGYCSIAHWPYQTLDHSWNPIGGPRIPIGSLVLLLAIFPAFRLHRRLLTGAPEDRREIVELSAYLVWLATGITFFAWFVF